ncbi:MAG: ABC transporter ATP-binding protein, partial [Deltaproteobacteria bacterium GWC2_56_8]
MLLVKNVSAFYGFVEALSEVSIAVKEGEIVAIVGSNGAGKSTLLKCISRLIKFQKGNISFNNTNIFSWGSDVAVKEGIVMVPEGRLIFNDLTVRENLELGAYTRRDGKINDDMKMVIELFPVLGRYLKRPAAQMSGGEQQMLAIARGLMTKPKLLMMDEPSMGLSPNIVKSIFQAIVDIKKEGVTVLLVEQNARIALSIVDRGYVL